MKIDKINEFKKLKINEDNELFSGDYKDIIEDNDNTFIFLDPPYTRAFKEYTSGNIFDMEEQQRLADTLIGLKKSKWMLIINNDDAVRKMYDGYVKKTYDIKYGTNIKNRYDNSTQHMIITNY